MSSLEVTLSVCYAKRVQTAKAKRKRNKTKAGF